VLNKKPPQGWPQALKKCRHMNLGRKINIKYEPAQAQAAGEVANDDQDSRGHEGGGGDRRRGT
jgi:hypothetical protein